MHRVILFKCNFIEAWDSVNWATIVKVEKDSTMHFIDCIVHLSRNGNNVKNAWKWSHTILVRNDIFLSFIHYSPRFFIANVRWMLRSDQKLMVAGLFYSYNVYYKTTFDFNNSAASPIKNPAQDKNDACFASPSANLDNRISPPSWFCPAKSAT